MPKLASPRRCFNMPTAACRGQLTAACVDAIERRQVQNHPRRFGNTSDAEVFIFLYLSSGRQKHQTTLLLGLVQGGLLLLLLLLLLLPLAVTSYAHRRQRRWAECDKRGVLFAGMCMNPLSLLGRVGEQSVAGMKLAFYATKSLSLSSSSTRQDSRGSSIKANLLLCCAVLCCAELCCAVRCGVRVGSG